MSHQIEEPDELAHLQILHLCGQAGTRIDAAIRTHVVRKTFRLEGHLMMKFFVVHGTSLREQVDRSLTVARLLIPWNPENCTVIASPYPLALGRESSLWH